jgi:hypothetical protein
VALHLNDDHRILRQAEPPMSHAGSCWSCAHPLDAADRYCRHCGNGQGRFLQWYDRPVWIMVLTVTAPGPLSPSL